MMDSATTELTKAVLRLKQSEKRVSIKRFTEDTNLFTIILSQLGQYSGTSVETFAPWLTRLHEIIDDNKLSSSYVRKQFAFLLRGPALQIFNAISKDKKDVTWEELAKAFTNEEIHFKSFFTQEFDESLEDFAVRIRAECKDIYKRFGRRTIERRIVHHFVQGLPRELEKEMLNQEFNTVLQAVACAERIQKEWNALEEDDNSINVSSHFQHLTNEFRFR